MSKKISSWTAICVAGICCMPVAIAQTKNPNIVKVPCRDMGDGRVLIDSLYLPDWANSDTISWDIIHKRATSMEGEWANLVCTIKLKTQSAAVPAGDPNHAEPMCNTEACGQVAEAASRQAYETCRRGGGQPDICTKKALDAWLATGAIPPYAHPCTAVGIPKDYLGRCR